jgi:integrating conjugative element protein (TIGR03765 family)
MGNTKALYVASVICISSLAFSGMVMGKASAPTDAERVIEDSDTIDMSEYKGLTDELSYQVNQAARDVVELSKLNKKPLVIFTDLSKSVPLSEVVDVDTLENAEAISARHTQSEIAEQLKSGTLDKASMKQAILNSHFPVESRFKSQQLMVREYPIPKTFSLSLVTPVVVIGTDDYSYKWLQMNIDELRRIKAEFMLTEVETYEQYKEFAAMVYPLRVAPVVADVMLSELKVNAYPIVVSRAGAFQ